MSIGELCVRQVVCAPGNLSVRQAASLMREHHIGALIISETVQGRLQPTGVVTDRDIVVGVVAKGLDADMLTVGEIAARDLVTVHACDSVTDTAELMRVKGVRRLPVVDDQGTLVGIVTADDLLGVLAAGMGSLAKMINREQRRESDLRP